MSLHRDLGYSIRQLRKSPWFTVTVVLTLALCIGANSAIYSLVNAVFFRALPYPHPEKLLQVTTLVRSGQAEFTGTGQDGATWEAVRDGATLLQPAVVGAATGVNMAAGTHVEYVQAQSVGAAYFAVLGAPPMMGRSWTNAEDVPDGPPLVVLSFHMWRHLFGSNKEVLGRNIDVRGAPHTIVGVMPETFRVNQPTDIWLPLHPSRNGQGGGTNYQIIGRLREGATIAAAGAEINKILQPLLKQSGRVSAGSAVTGRVQPLRVASTIDQRMKVHLMWSAVAIVLLIGCLNISSLLLARSAARKQEVAVRFALGGTRLTIMRQLLLESLLMATAGGALGLLLGAYLLSFFQTMDPGQFYLWGAIQMDLPVVGVMMVVSLGTSIVFGLFPAWETTSVDLRSAMAENSRNSAGGRIASKRQLLILAEVSLGVMLVVSAALLLQTLRHLSGLHPGFDGANVTAGSASLDDVRYRSTSRGAQLFARSIREMGSIPGVESAAVALAAPYQMPFNMWVERIPGEPAPQESANFTYVTAEYFKTLHIPITTGRVFTDADNETGRRVAVVSQDFVKHYLPNHPDRAVGAEILIDGTNWQVVGIVPSVLQLNQFGEGFGGPLAGLPQVYVPVAQVSDGLFSLAHSWLAPSWLVRTRGEIPHLADAMRRKLERVDPRLPFSSFHNMAQLETQALSDQRSEAALFLAVALLALLLAAIGIYGLIAQTIAQRTREMGIRLALGASNQKLMVASVLPGVVLSAIGVGTGLILSLLIARLLNNFLWGVAATDPGTYLGSGILLIVVAAVASVLPSLRLLQLDPAQTLRNE